MERRHFIKSALIGATAGAALTGCSNDRSDAPAIQTDGPSLRWRLASSFSSSLDIIYGAADVMAQRVSQLTGGRFTIRIYPAGEIVPAFEVLESVQKGTVQLGYSASYYYIGKNPAFAFDTAIPFGLTARQYNSWAYHGGGQDIMKDLFADYGILSFPGGNTGTQMGGWFNRKINSLSDLRGLTMRIPGLGGHVMDRLGISVQQIPGGEIYPALERGVIDAAEWVGPYDDEKLGFHQIARYYYYPGWWEPGANLSFYVNQSAFQELPSHYQNVLEAAMIEANMYMISRYDAVNPPAFQRLTDTEIEVLPFPSDVMTAALTTSRELILEGTSDPIYAKIYNSYMSWLNDTNKWFGTAAHTYNDYILRS